MNTPTNQRPAPPPGTLSDGASRFWFVGVYIEIPGLSATGLALAALPNLLIDSLQQSLESENLILPAPPAREQAALVCCLEERVDLALASRPLSAPRWSAPDVLLPQASQEDRAALLTLKRRMEDLRDGRGFCVSVCDNWFVATARVSNLARALQVLSAKLEGLNLLQYSRIGSVDSHEAIVRTPFPSGCVGRLLILDIALLQRVAAALSEMVGGVD